MNPEQVKSTLRTLLATFGGMIAGWFGAKGWLTSDQVMAVLTSETFLGIVTSIVVGVWGIFVHTQQNAVAVVGTIAKDPQSPVRAVIMEPTKEGVAIAQAITKDTEVPVVPAGTVQAAELSKGRI